jgi:hypothetical protein
VKDRCYEEDSQLIWRTWSKKLSKEGGYLKSEVIESGSYHREKVVTWRLRPLYRRDRSQQDMAWRAIGRKPVD